MWPSQLQLARKGPYTDHGPIMCQPDGSIDPSFVRDEHGQPFLIWKEDGNSEGKPDADMGAATDQRSSPR